LFNHIGYGSKNPFAELSQLNPETLFRRTVPWESLWSTRKSWNHFYKRIVPTLVRLSETE